MWGIFYFLWQNKWDICHEVFYQQKIWRINNFFTQRQTCCSVMECSSFVWHVTWTKIAFFWQHISHIYFYNKILSWRLRRRNQLDSMILQKRNFHSHLEISFGHKFMEIKFELEKVFFLLDVKTVTGSIRLTFLC